MAGKRKKRRSGLIAFLIVIASALAVAVVLALLNTTGGTVKFGAFGAQGAANEAAGAKNAAVSAASGADDATVSRNDDLITGTLYDPENGIFRDGEEGTGTQAAAGTTEAKAAEDGGTGTGTDSKASVGESAGNAAADAPPSEKEAPPAEEKQDSFVYVTASDVNIRSSAGTDGEILGKGQRGQKLEKTGESGDWTEISLDGKTAYIKSEFVSEEEPQAVEWDLGDLSSESVDFGYSSANRDENNVPTDWEWYEDKWGQFNVDWIQDTSKNTIYLTMDEGFGNDNTIRILDTLKEKGVNVTFFLTKYFFEERPELIRRMLDEGHQLGNHTCTHPRMPDLTIEEQTDQVMTLHNLIKDNYGYEMKVFRYPEGAYSSQSLGLINNLGYKAVFWSYAYGDYDENNQPPVDESLEKALGALHNGAIYLLHASSDTNTAMLADFIDGARDRGFEFGRYPLD